MMQTGLFPLTGLLVGLSLYALYAGLLRLKADSRWAQAFIAFSALLISLASVMAPVRTVYVVEAKDFVLVEQPDMQTAEPSPTLTASIATDAPESADAHPAEMLAWKAEATVHLLASDASVLFGTLYLVGIAAVALYFVLQLLWLFSLRRRYPKQAAEGYDLYLTDALPPFSFGRSIFLPRRLDEAVGRYVLLHEQMHVAHRHFLKLCLMQLLVAVNWYNPFVWLLFGEMRLQQELEVDGDVLHQGVDREAYQMSLLRICTEEGKWILLRSGFVVKPLKQRIIFMNKQMNTTGMRRRQTVAALGLVLVAMTAAVVGCQHREVININEAHRHPMRGCWTMDWISDTGSGEEVHPVAMHYGFYNDSTFLCFSYWRRQGVNMKFSLSGEGYTWQGDSLLDAAGNLTSYTLSDDGRTALSRWLKDSTQMAGVSGPDITEQWSRIRPCEDIVRVFRAVMAAARNEQHPLDGTWERETPAPDGRRQCYCLVSDTIFMQIDWHPTTVARGFRYAGSGVCGSVDKLSGYVSQTADDRLLLLDANGQVAEVYRRTPMPAHLLRAFAPAAYIGME